MELFHPTIGERRTPHAALFIALKGPGDPIVGFAESVFTSNPDSSESFNVKAIAIHLIRD